MFPALSDLRRRWMASTSLASVARQLDSLTTLVEQIMATLADIQTKLDALTASVSAEETVITSVKTLLDGLVAMISSLKEQLAAAIAAGADPVQLQAVADGLDALATKVTADTADLANAVTTNTPTA